MVELHAHLLRSNPQRLRLMQHMLVRTDHDPSAPAGPRDWHADHGFVRLDYVASPRRVFYHAVIALKDILPGGGGTMLIPESLRRARQILDATPHRRLVKQCQATAENGFGYHLPAFAGVKPDDYASDHIIEITLRCADQHHVFKKDIHSMQQI